MEKTHRQFCAVLPHDNIVRCFLCDKKSNEINVCHKFVSICDCWCKLVCKPKKIKFSNSCQVQAFQEQFVSRFWQISNKLKLPVFIQAKTWFLTLCNSYVFLLAVYATPPSSEKLRTSQTHFQELPYFFWKNVKRLWYDAEKRMKKEIMMWRSETTRLSASMDGTTLSPALLTLRSSKNGLPTKPQN